MNEPLYAPLRRADELPGHVITEELAELHDRTFWRGCKAALVDGLPQCRGLSCNGGREPCTDRCGAEMAAGDTAPYPGFWRCLWAFLTDRRPY